MTKFKHKQFFCILMMLFTVPFITFSQDTKSHVSSDKMYIITYPANWKENKQEKNSEFCINAPGIGLFGLCMVKMEISKMAEGYENADIHQVADVELKMLKAQPQQNMNLEILESAFQERNDHEWWVVSGKLRNGSKEYFTDSYKTIHNKKVYIFTYFSNEKNYEKNKEEAKKIITSVEFLTKNEVGVSRQVPVQDKSEKPTNSTKATEDKNPGQGNAAGALTGNTAVVSNGGSDIKEPAVTYADFNDSYDEQTAIRKYGNGKVRKITNASVNKPNYELTLPGNKKILVGPFGAFLGYEPITNNYIFSSEDGAWVLINRTSGFAARDKSGYVSDFYDFSLKNFSQDKKWLAYSYLPDCGSFIKIYDVSGPLKKVFEEYGPDLCDDENAWSFGDTKWLDNNTLEVTKVLSEGKANEVKVIEKISFVLKNGKWIKVGKAGNTSANPNTNNSLSSPPKAEKFTPDHKVVGSNSIDELSRKILNAFKTNNFESYLQCVYRENTAGTKRRFNEIREQLLSRGLTDWAKVKFSRFTYYEHNNNPYDEDILRRNSYSLFKIEFSYSTNFLGTLGGSGVVKLDGKYYLGYSFDFGALQRK